ncbi:MAG: hypothetical protein U0704_12230 [Candidatus Eisenbacteria bacterium]
MTVAVLSGCGGAGGRERYVDRHPLPPDTMTVRMREPGEYGGRFVIGATASPKTFNPHVANERPSNDVCNLLYASLVDVDYMTQQDLPLLAKSWTVVGGSLHAHVRAAPRTAVQRRAPAHQRGRPVQLRGGVRHLARRRARRGTRDHRRADW